MTPEAVHLQFQGGFSARSVDVQFVADDGTELGRTILYPVDSNALQTLPLAATPVACNAMKLTFRDLSDLFGRVIIYNLDIIGAKRT